MSKFYVTTAIDYANSVPHLGTAYEKIGADVITRYRRMCGDDVFFLMGNDEHSQNVRRKAEEMGMDPKAYSDEMAVKFKETWKALHVSNDMFIQTSDPQHHQVVREIAKRIFESQKKKGESLIVKRPYEGFYCVSCEAFYDEKGLLDGLCPNHKTKPEWIREENYFFRLTLFADDLKKLFRENEHFVRPETRRNEVVSVLERGLEDVSISRANKTWGVKLPFDEDAVAYVWFDALINYVSALGEVEGKKFKQYWPADLHVIGKDITRFHCLIWPAMLMAAGLTPPKSVWAHGFISIRGEKMSKSRGNVTDPLALAKAYGTDALRYHLIREIPWDKDGDFSEERFVKRYNADLANDLGNLVSRTVTMVRTTFSDGVKKPSKWTLKTEIDRIQEVVAKYRALMDQYALAEAFEEAWKLVSEANLLIDRNKPWEVAKDPSRKDQLQEIFFVLLERIRWAAYLLSPAMPEKMNEVLSILGLNERVETFRFDKTPPPGSIPKFQTVAPSPLFPRLA